MSKPIDQKGDVNPFSDSENEGGGYPMDDADKTDAIKDFAFPGDDNSDSDYSGGDANEDGSNMDDGSDYPGNDADTDSDDTDNGDESDNDEDEDEDDDDDDGDENEDSGKDDGKKGKKSGKKREAVESGQKSKLKAYAMVGGIGVVMASLIGGTMLYKNSLKSQGTASQAIPLDIDAGRPIPVAAEPAPVKPQPKPKRQAEGSDRNMTPMTAIAAVNSENTPQSVPYVRGDQADQGAKPEQIAGQPEEIAAPGQVLEPVPPPMFVKTSDAAQEQDATEDEEDASAGITSKQFEELSSKADMLAEVMLRSQDRVNSHIEEAKAAVEKAEKAIEDHETRISELEGAVKELKEMIEGLNPKKKVEVKKKAEPKAKPKPAAKVTASASSNDDDEDLSPKSTLRMKVEPIRAQGKSTKNAISVQGYSVVATYPSTNPGVAPERAWVTNGEKLIQVTVGSSVSGARVTKIVGTNVHTSAGTIRVAR